MICLYLKYYVLFFALGEKIKQEEVMIVSIIQKILLAVTIIGGINWLLIGVFNFNLVYFITMENDIASRIIYSIVGICSIVNIALLFLHNRHHMEEF